MNIDLKKRIITSFCLLLLLYLILSFDKILVYTLIVLGVLSTIEFNSLICCKLLLYFLIKESKKILFKNIIDKRSSNL